MSKQESAEVTSILKEGSMVFIRTVTMYYTGRIVQIYSGFLTLEDAAWIGDTGRFSHALRTGELAEVEPYPGPVAVNMAHITDVCIWAHPLPREVK